MANYGDEKLLKVCEKAQVCAGKNPNEIRPDPCGALIKKQDYGLETG
ncbi:MAG: hypothetical protein SGJ00_10050 [bacterium]|nr:hypothetical protein [bacterium]